MPGIELRGVPVSCNQRDMLQRVNLCLLLGQNPSEQRRSLVRVLEPCVEFVRELLK